jgi:hypothetical protein
MKQVVKLSGFILIIIGTLGLLITEFIFHGGSPGSLNFTLIFGAANVLGFATLAFAHWGMK